MKQKRNWSGNDKHFGPFTYSVDTYKAWGVVVDSGADENQGCCVRIRGFGRALIIELPSIIKPWRRWVDTSGYDWSTNPRGGFFDEHHNEYGFYVSDGFLQVFLGPQTGDSATTRNWCKFLPWTEWRFNRFSLYGIQGEHVWTQHESNGISGFDKFEAQHAAEKACPSATFTFDDFDGERISVRTHIEEREWLFGEGWFRWLSWFRKPKVRRTLSLEFSKETGKRKGSWKGGTLGHRIEMLPNELHQSAFRRYCEANNMIFVGAEA